MLKQLSNKQTSYLWSALNDSLAKSLRVPFQLCGLSVKNPSMLQPTAVFHMTAFLCPLCPPDSLWRRALLLKKSADYVCDVSCHSSGSPPVEPRCSTTFIYSTLRISLTALARRGQTPQAIGRADWSEINYHFHTEELRQKRGVSPLHMPPQIRCHL